MTLPNKTVGLVLLRPGALDRDHRRQTQHASVADQWIKR